MKSKVHEPRRKALIVAVAFCDNGKRLFSQNGTDVKQNDTIHAEARLIKKAMKIHTRVHTMYVMRFDRNGDLQCAKPCKKCLKKIARAWIRNVWYTDTCNWWCSC